MRVCESIRLLRRRLGRLVVYAVPVFAVITVSAVAADAQAQGPIGYDTEITLSSDEALDAIRYLQARIVQPYDDGRYFVRAVRVLHPASGNVAVFAYLVTFQTNVPDNLAYDLADSYSTAGYYLVLIMRSGEDFTVIDEISLTPPQLRERLSLWTIPPPPELACESDELDFSDAVFDATDPALSYWREDLVQCSIPRWEWKDVTGEGLLDCILDIEGFEFQPTSYYVILVPRAEGFIEGFRSWGYDTDFSEVESDGLTAVRAAKYSPSPDGDFLPSWLDYYIWNGMRFILANLNFADEYSDLVPSLEQLAESLVEEESSDGSRWSGLPRYVINATRYADGLGTPFQYYYNLARIAEYQSDPETADRWWLELRMYLDAEYDSRILVDESELDRRIIDTIPAYEEWRDEMYAAAEAALSAG